MSRESLYVSMVSCLLGFTFGVTRGLSQGGQSLAEEGPQAKTPKKVKK